MKTISALALASFFLSLLGCGGGGGGSTPPATSSAPLSSVSPSSSSIASSSLPEASSSAPLSVSSSLAVSSSSVAASSLYPSYNLNPLPADNTGMTSTAVEIASNIKLGFNFGNTMEAIGSETAWGNPLITAAQMKMVKDAGFDAIRLPVSWDQYANQETAEIKAEWLSRVKQVVQYAVDNGLYVVVNIHWDGGWLENDITPAKREAVNAKQKAFWEQIATQLRDFDEHVLFAGTNEPDVEDAAQMAQLDSYHQTFVDAVRATGGKNANRVLVVQGPITDIDKTNALWVAMPNDSVANKLMMEIHYYSPWNFTGMTKDEGWGNQFFYWGKDFHSTTDTAHNPTWGEEDYVNAQFLLMKTQFVDKGVPVIMGEFGTGKREQLTGADLQLHLDSRAFYFKYITQQALAHGLKPFVWDTGSLFNRNTLNVGDQQVLDALLQGAGKASNSSSSSSSTTSSVNETSSAATASVTTSSAQSSSSSSTASNLLTLDVNSSNWEAGTGVVMNKTNSEIQLNLNSANQEVFYNIDGPINLVGATFTLVFNFDSAFVTAMSDGMTGFLQFVAFERTGWSSDYVCYTGWKTLVAGQDISLSCTDFTKNNPQPEGARIGVQFFSNTGTVTIKNATLELAQ